MPGAAATSSIPGDPELQIVSLFSGIAGLDHGMEMAGATVVEMCESWAPARRVLRERFPDVPVGLDVAEYTPRADYSVLTAGFPCTDLSHAGTKAGIFGPQSGLVSHVFRIAKETRPPWIVLENVPNLLLLHAGAGIASVVDRLEELGYTWAYRTVDSRFTGVPQRRYRVILVASLVLDPATILMQETSGPEGDPRTTGALAADGNERRRAIPHGFYWTEGRHGGALVPGAIPTLKGGSTLGTPSAPAVWVPDAPRGRKFVLPTVEDGEELQGLPRGWTAASTVDGERDMRWKLLGNAVTSGVGTWVAQCLADTPRTVEPDKAHRPLKRGTRWPRAATGGPGRAAVAVDVSDRPHNVPMKSLHDVIDTTAAPAMSHRATKGFLSRVDEKDRRLNRQWYHDLEEHLSATRPRTGSPTRGSGQSWASSAQSRSRMQRQKQKDTKPELTMRRELTALGLRYRLQKRPLPESRARLDIVFMGAKVAVDVRGCFWHGCPTHGTAPKLNADRWSEKLRRNRERDIETVQALEDRGWLVVVVWEHDDPAVKAREVAALVKHRKPGTQTRVRGGGPGPVGSPEAELPTAGESA